LGRIDTQLKKHLTSKEGVDIVHTVKLQRIRTGSTINWKVYAKNGIPIDTVDDYVKKMMPDWVVVHPITK